MKVDKKKLFKIGYGDNLPHHLWLSYNTVKQKKIACTYFIANASANTITQINLSVRNFNLIYLFKLFDERPIFILG